ncbi:MAG: RNA polymerase subunit sigma-24 [Micavibrio sp.]|nr:RNA polymerase subunit sigma-24 [Micavibrio sp.]|tara:strand:+ start:3793 stop:4335 length:543 start_codon:yes stop_codon:yes gene_type:complete
MFADTELLEQQENLKKFALKLTRNESNADDLLQATLLRALEKKELFNEGTNLFSWTSRIMYNMFVSNWRRKVKFESQYDPEPYINAETTEASQDVKMELASVNEAMKELNDEHKEIMIMVCVQGMPYQDVADELNIPIGTVRSRLSRARTQLQQILESTHGRDALLAKDKAADAETRYAA